MTDQMFLVILFAVFAVCAFSLSMIGANIYSHTASVMNEDYEERIDISYVTEKIRQWDEKDSIEIGSFHGRTTLIHTEKINGKKYNTYLYQEKGALRELMVREGLDTTTMQGEKIVAAKDFSEIETKVEGDQVVLNITSNINKEDKILNADLQISYSTINGIKVEKIPLIIDKGKLTFVYKIHSEQNPFILPAEGGRFESPFTCKKQTYLNGQFIEETYSSLNGLRFKTISSGNVWFLTVRKDGEKIGFYKFSFVGE